MCLNPDRTGMYDASSQMDHSSLSSPPTAQPARKSLPFASAMRDFIKVESAGGVVLLSAAILALIIANTPLSGLYAKLLEVSIGVQVGGLMISNPLFLWVNDGLMAVSRSRG